MLTSCASFFVFHTPSGDNSTVPVRAVFTTHDPIQISGDTDFTPGNGVVSGSGTLIDPYMIEGWEISALTSDAITIANTTSYFVVRNVLINSGGTSNDGVTLSNLTNGLVDDSSISGCRYGVHLENSSMVAVDDNSIDACHLNGVYVRDSDNCTIDSNDVSNTMGTAITNCGIYAYESENISIARNAVTSNSWDGIDVRMSFDIDVKFNNVSTSLETGLWYDSTDGGSVFGNDFYMNGGSGVVFWSTSNVIVEACDISYQSPFGIDLQGCSGIQLFHNNLFENGANAVDQGGSGNVWDDGYPSGGNYWDDYAGTDSDLDGIGDTPHYFDADSSDQYPLIEPFNLTLAQGWIHINGDDQFLPENGVTEGSGSQLDPYVIEGWELNASTAAGIHIENTRAYFVVNEVTVTSVTSAYQGILLSNTTNGTVTSSMVNECSYGIEIVDSAEIAISYSTFNASDINGIFFHEVSNCTADSNYVTGTTGTAITNCGIYVYSSVDVDISANNVSHNGWDGVDIRVCTRIDVYRNEIVSNSITGFWLDQSNNCSVSNNNVSDNGGTGVVFWDVVNSYFVYNKVSSNGNYGIDLRSSSGVLIHHNAVSDQWDNAYDDSTENQWDNGYPDGGNYWGDYSGTDTNSDGIGDNSYDIGPCGTDRYPLMTEPVTIPEFSGSLPFVVIIMLVAFLFVSHKRRRP